ncbi:hypothetical protein H0N96_02915 [Candidatus Micrarchaeota archaeon]|nr:hypothetical protein [Candidatus Micrarchaeota archaeon]
MPFERGEKPRIKFLGVRKGLDGTALFDVLKHVNPKTRVGVELTEAELNAVKDVISLEGKKRAGAKLTKTEEKFVKGMPEEYAFVKEVVKRIAVKGATPVALIEEKLVKKYWEELDEIRRKVESKKNAFYHAYSEGRGSNMPPTETPGILGQKLATEYDFRLFKVGQTILKNAWKKADIAVVDVDYLKNIQEFSRKLKPKGFENKSIQFKFL